MAVSAEVPQVEAETAMEPGTLVIGVLMGGCSRERSVSLESGQAVAAALEALGHDVRPCDVRPGDITPHLFKDVDVAFLALHGAWGEDGQVQSELEALGVCYTGSGPEASRLAMDKAASKQRFFEEGVPTPAFRVARRGEEAVIEEAYNALGPDLIVKPIAEGSSFGLGACRSLESLRTAVRDLWSDYDAALVERRVIGKELTVGILGERPLPVAEIRTPGGLYDFHFKYESDETEYIFNHGLAAEVEARMVEVALAAHGALGCRDLSRVDLMLPPEGEPQVLEVNTIPGFTSHSLVPKAAVHAGITFGHLCERIVALARERSVPPKTCEQDTEESIGSA